MDTTCDLSDAIYHEEDGIIVGCTQATRGTDERNDCSVITLAVAADIPYARAHELLKSWGRKDNSYSPSFYAFTCDGPFRWRRCVRRTRTIRSFIRRHPTGSYILLLRPRSPTCHVVAVVDGALYNCGTDSLKCRVIEAWKFGGKRKELT